MRLVHDGLTEEQAARHAEGWNHFLDRLVAAGQRGEAGLDEWAAAPDPVDELSCAEATLAVLQHVLCGFDASDLARQTPCAEYNVAQLADHLMGSITTIGTAGGAQMPARNEDAPLETQVADAAQGTPNWVDLHTTDQDAAKEFYTSLLGWSYADNPMPGDGVYSEATLNWETVAAIAPMPPGAPEGMPPMWNTYIAVDYADAGFKACTWHAVVAQDITKELMAGIEPAISAWQSVNRQVNLDPLAASLNIDP